MQPMENLQVLVGKTLESIDDTADSCLTLTFTDGTVVTLEAENLNPPNGLIGIVSYRVK